MVNCNQKAGEHTREGSVGFKKEGESTKENAKRQQLFVTTKRVESNRQGGDFSKIQVKYEKGESFAKRKSTIVIEGQRYEKEWWKIRRVEIVQEKSESRRGILIMVKHYSSE